jgi:hypothetical protein
MRSEKEYTSASPTNGRPTLSLKKTNETWSGILKVPLNVASRRITHQAYHRTPSVRLTLLGLHDMHVTRSSRLHACPIGKVWLRSCGRVDYLLILIVLRRVGYGDTIVENCLSQLTSRHSHRQSGSWTLSAGVIFPVFVDIETCS